MTFEEIRALFKDYTAVCDDRQRLIYRLVTQTKSVLGAMAEIGVYRGGTSLLITTADPERCFFACDTFEGLPAPTPGVDTHSEGDFKDTAYESVRTLLPERVAVIQGVFPDKYIHRHMYTRGFSFVHIDVDLYQPTLDCLKFFYAGLVPGGALVVDDYGMPSCPGVKKAVDEFMADKSEKIIDSGFKSCYFTKE